MSDQLKRLESWKVKPTPERTKATLDARHAEMERRYEEAMALLYAADAQVRQVLNEEGVHTSSYVQYLNYGRQLWKLGRQGISGESLAMAAKVLLDKWAARGLDPDVLAAVRFKVFNVQEPTP